MVYIDSNGVSVFFFVKIYKQVRNPNIPNLGQGVRTLVYSHIYFQVLLRPQLLSKYIIVSKIHNYLNI